MRANKALLATWWVSGVTLNTAACPEMARPMLNMCCAISSSSPFARALTSANLQFYVPMRITLLLFYVAVALGSQLDAATLIYQEASRNTSGSDLSQITQTGIGSFNSAVAAAGSNGSLNLLQVSTIGDDSIYGSFSNEVSPIGSDWENSDNRLTASFVVLVDTPFRLSGNISSQLQGGASFLQGTLKLRGGPTGTILDGAYPYPGSSDPFDLSGVFYPGWQYDLDLHLFTSMSGPGHLINTLTFTLVAPEPTRTMLVVLGSFATVVRRRRSLSDPRPSGASKGK
jgi:hypothetical protein